MSYIALLLVLLAAILHAAWNYVLKLSQSSSSFVFFYETIAFLIYIPLLFFVDFNRLLTLPLEAWLLIVLSALLHVIYSLVLQTAYRHADYSVVYPMARGTGPALTVIVAILLFGEKISSLGLFGVCAVILGIVLVATPNKGAVLKSPVFIGVLWGIATGVFIAAYSSLDGFAIQLLGLTPLMYYVPGMAVRLFVLAPPVLSKQSLRENLREDLKKRWKYGLFIGFAHPLAYLLVLFALLYAPLAYVAPTREISMMLALFIGAKALKEKISKTRILGVLSMLIGIVSICLS